jgi:hypothetical protein
VQDVDMRSDVVAFLPEQVCFPLGEASWLLSAVDVAVQHSGIRSPQGQAARRAQRLIVRRLWPELGRLLDDSDNEEA